MAKQKSPKRNRPKKPPTTSDEQSNSSKLVGAPNGLKKDDDLKKDGRDLEKPKRQWWRVGLSLLIVFHLIAVMMPPMAMQAEGEFGRSPSVKAIMSLVSRYGEFLYLDRGYAFFAPDPGPSHLIQALVTQPDGEQSEVLYPNREQQWPRLSYHRHFMITEYLSGIYEVPAPPNELLNDPDPVVRKEAREWDRRRARYELVRKSIADHLKPDGGEALIGRRERVIPSFAEYVGGGVPINDPRYLTELRDIPVIGPIGPPESVPAPEAAKVDNVLKEPASDSQDSADPIADDADTAKPESAAADVESAGTVKPESKDVDEPAAKEIAKEKSKQDEPAKEKPRQDKPAKKEPAKKEPAKQNPAKQNPAQGDTDKDSTQETAQ